MPNKSSNNNNKKMTNKQNKQSQMRKQRKNKNQSSRPGLDSKVLDYAKLLADPCAGPLVGPQYGGSEAGYLARLKREQLVATTTNTSGYIVWFPDYSGVIVGDTSTAHRNGSYFLFTADDPSSAPVNSTADPMGTSTDLASTKGSFLLDPARNLLAGSTVQDIRTVAGCIEFMYTGALQDASGRFGIIEGISREQLLTGASGGPSSVSDMFAVSKHITRTPLDKVEVKYRPSVTGQYFRSEGLNATDNAASDSADACFHTGIPGTSATNVHSTGSTSGSAMGIGFVWAGLPANSSFAFTATKAIEWRPEIGNGIVLPVPRSVSGTNKSAQVVAFLDRTAPGWTTMAKRAVNAGATALTTAVFSGNLPAAAASAGMKFLMN